MVYYFRAGKPPPGLHLDVVKNGTVLQVIMYRQCAYTTLIPKLEFITVFCVKGMHFVKVIVISMSTLFNSV